MNTMSPISPPPHVLLFPLPLQGPIKVMLMLAELLCQAGIQVTFLNTEHNHLRLLRHSDTKLRFSEYPNFRMETVPDGLPEDHPRALDRISELFANLTPVIGPLFRQMMTTGSLSVSSERPVTFLIAEGALEFANDVADEVGIPLVYFDTLSPCSVLTFFSIHKLIEAGKIPFRGEDLDEPIKSVPGMEAFLRRRDLPQFYRTQDLNSDFSVSIVLGEGKRFPRGHGLVLNTFEDLDAPILSHIKTLTPNIYPIGPLHTLVKSRKITGRKCSLWQEDRSCIKCSIPNPINLYYTLASGILLLSQWSNSWSSGTGLLIAEYNSCGSEGQIRRSDWTV